MEVVARPANPAIGKNIVHRAVLLSGWCCSFRGRLRPFLGTVTRPQVAGLG